MPALAAFDAKGATVGQRRMLSIREHRYPFLKKVDDWNRFNRYSGGTFVEKCCHFFDLMRLFLKAEPVRVFASAAQDVNHLAERYGGAQPDIWDNGYVIIDFDNGCRGMLDLCMFADGPVAAAALKNLRLEGVLTPLIFLSFDITSPFFNNKIFKHNLFTESPLNLELL